MDRQAIGLLIGSKVFKGGVLDQGAGHIHPLNFALGLAKAAQKAGAQLFERSEVIEIVQGPKPLVRTSLGHVRADQLIWAGSMPRWRRG